MKILRITATGLPLIKGKLDLRFYAQQRVSERDEGSLYKLMPRIYLNPVTVFTGINASGKTTVLRIIDFAVNLLNSEPINHIETRSILGNAKEAKFGIYFYTNDDQIGFLSTTITAKKQRGCFRYRITGERLYSKRAAAVSSRKSLCDFTGAAPVISRSEEQTFLSEDVSIVIAEKKKTPEEVRLVSLFSPADLQLFRDTEEVPVEVLHFLDPGIESLRFEQGGNGLIRLKVKGEDEILLRQPQELARYLSAGTLRGIGLFMSSIDVLDHGGCLIVDDVESHLNREAAATLPRFFMDGSINQNGAMLLCSTHDPALLDESGRNDNIYLTRSRSGITADNLSDLLKRNDFKKSELYESGYLAGTAPSYDAYMELKKSLQGKA